MEHLVRVRAGVKARVRVRVRVRAGVKVKVRVRVRARAAWGTSARHSVERSMPHMRVRSEGARLASRTSSAPGKG